MLTSFAGVNVHTLLTTPSPAQEQSKLSYFNGSNTPLNILVWTSAPLSSLPQFLKSLLEILAFLLITFF